MLGSIKTPKKTESSRRNVKIALQHARNQGRKPWPLSRYECTCGKGEALEGHAWDCPRGQAIKRRLKKGQPLE